jgi:hypothetical protein
MRLSLVFFVLLTACSSRDGASDGAEQNDTEKAASDAWGPLVQLRDDTDTFAGRPQGGWFVTPIHASLLADGRVLVNGWGRRDADTCTFPEGSRNHGTSFVVDPNALPKDTLLVQPIDEAGLTADGFTPDVLYCSGHVPLADGRWLFVGGSRYQNLGEGAAETEIGIDYARTFDPAAGAFTRVDAPMLGGPASSPIRPGQKPVDKRGWHWYPTATRMPDGSVVVSGGFTGGPNGSQSESNLSVERFDPKAATWSLLVQHDDAPAVAEAMSPGTKDYTHTLLLPDGRLAMMGWNGQVLLMDDQSRFSLGANGVRPGDGKGTAPSWDSTAALAPSGEILVMGGTNTPGVARRVDLYDPVKGAWRSIDTGIGRRNAATVLLPDGRVLVMNGWDEDGNLPGDRRRPQIVDPATGKVDTFGPWADDAHDRGYHSFALLLKDGRVLLGGGIYPKVNGVQVTSIGCERTDLRIYEPAYLKAGPRPVVDVEEPVALSIGGTAQIRVSGANVAKVALLALGSFTHGFDQNQRYVALDHDGTTIKAPASASVAPPGDYLLFVVSDKGVPSVGKHVRLAP